ncbi:MAG: hypothetical protein E7525_03660 [Ruminococcaceae bacterium]|nr:hypothetical protein [Oscillospiraceae bacterium]
MGHIDVAFQTYTFLLSLCLGCAFCIVYDLLRAVRKFKLNSTVATFVTDVLFWHFAALVTYAFLLLTVKGQVRSFVIFGIFASFVTFRITLSRLVFTIFIKVLTIFDIILHTSSKFADRILSTINKSFKNLVFTCKKLLQRWVKLLYNCFKVSLKGKKGDRRGSRNQT